jgi:hypothetical protein
MVKYKKLFCGGAYVMSQFEFVSCRLAIQICIGHFPDGRERHRTFSVKNIKPDAAAAALITVVRAVGSLIAYPITGARLIVKKRRVLFGAERDMDPKESVASETCVPETRGEAPERVTKPLVAGRREARMESVFAKQAEPTEIAADACLFLKTFLAVFRRPYPKYQLNLNTYSK